MNNTIMQSFLEMREMVQDAKITLLKGSIDNIASDSTKFLGHLLGESLQALHQAAFERK